jgi:hypothetical protein
MKIKTSELTGETLDWAVDMAKGLKFGTGASNSTDWRIGGPIIEMERMCLSPPGPKGENGWTATRFRTHRHEGVGPTPLIAAMRCFVASKLGDEVDVPEELL